MTLAAVLDQAAHDALPDLIKAEYIENPNQAGQFLPDIRPEAGFEFTNTAALTKALETERHTATEGAKLLKQFEGIDATIAKQAIAKYDELKNANPEEKAKEQFEAMKGDLISAHVTEMDTQKQLVKTVMGQLQNNLIDAQATKAIQEAGGSIELLLPHVKNQVQMRQSGDNFIAEVVNGEGVARIAGSAGTAMTIPQLVEEMKSKDTFGGAFVGTGNSGSGAGSGDSTDKNTGKQGATNTDGAEAPASVDASDQNAVNNSLESIAKGDTKVSQPG